MPAPLRQSMRSLLGALDADPALPSGFTPYVPPHTPAAPPPLAPDARADLSRDRALYELLDRRGLPVPPERPTWNRQSNPALAGRSYQPQSGPLAAGVRRPGNIDLAGQPEVTNPDGSISTVASIGFQETPGGEEIVIPTVVGQRRVSPEAAIAAYRQTGRHLGTFDTPAQGAAYGQQLHDEYARGQYRRKAGR